MSTHIEQTEAAISEWIHKGLEAQMMEHARDLARKLDAILDMLEPGRGLFGSVVDGNTVSLSVNEWKLIEQIQARAIAIAEGRTP